MKVKLDFQSMDLIKPAYEFLLNGRIDKFIHDFRNPSMESISNTLTYYDAKSDSIRTTIVATEDFPFEYCRIIFFQEVLILELDKIELKCLTSLEKFRKKYQSSGNKLRDTCKFISDRIQLIIHEIEGKNILKQYIGVLKAFLFNIDSLANKILNSKKIITEVASFKCCCTESVLMEIYKLDIKHHSFINRLQTSESDFLKIFTSSDLSKVESNIKIYLGCDTSTAAYIFEQMKRFFKNLNRKSIAESGRFCSKQGNMIYTNNLEVAFGRFEKRPKSKNYLDIFFAELVISSKKM